MILSNAALENRTTILVIVVFIIITGVWSYLSLPRESAPDVEVPNILITTINEGVSPEDIESGVTNKIETELSGLKGLEEITSTSQEGVSVVNVEFKTDVDIDDALQRVKDKVDLAKPELPVEAEEPVITEINIAELPIMMINIAGPISPVRLKAIAEELEDAIEMVPGVLDVDVLGALEREIRIEIDPDRTAAYDLTVEELVALIPSENVNVSAGGLETPGTRFNVRVPAEIVRPDEVDEFPLTTRNGKTIYLSDVATVRDTFKDRESISRLNGVPSISVSVQKRIGENIVRIADDVKRVLAAAEKQVPAGVEFYLIMDQSKDIRLMVADLENNILSGLILVVLVLLLFLGFRPSLIVGIAIPLSMLMSFAIIQMMGVTLNMVVLFSLILALGMLVDNAIVIVENIYRHRQLGLGRIEAAKVGASEVAWPVIASTATTIAAFSPMLFWPGVMGEFMSYLPLTLIITLSSSLFVALIINPVICSMVVPRNVASNEDKGEPMIIRSYRRVLSLALAHQPTTLALAVLTLVGVAVLFGRRNYGVELFPDIDPAQGIVNIKMPQGTNIYETDRIARIVEQRLEDPSVRPYIENIASNVGSAGGGFMQDTGPHIANLTLVFADFNDRRRPSELVLQDVRKLLEGIPGADIKVDRPDEGPPTGSAVTVRLIGRDFRMLEQLGEQAKNLIVDVPGLVNLRSDFEAARPELTFNVDRKRAMQLGVSTAQIGNFLKTAIFGREVSKFRQFNDEYDITIRLPVRERTSVDDIVRLRVPSTAGTPVPLTSLGSFSYRPGLGTIHRIDSDRVVTLTADAEGRLDTDVLADAQQRLAEMDLPAGYEIRYAGKKEEEDKASAFLSKAFIVALLLIVGILVTQFNTLSAPLIIITTVVLSTIGVFAGLLICKMPFGIIMTGVGVISLAGVVVNNAIVLLDYTRQLQRRGQGVIEAAVEAGVTRLRPVLLTATTTILGLVPMATGVSFDFRNMQMAWRSETSQWWASMAIAVIFGLGFATVLTLVIVPTLYVLSYRVASFFGFGGLLKPSEKEAAAAKVWPAE